MPRLSGSSQNRLLTTDMMALEALFQLRNNLVWPSISERQYERYFEEMIGGVVSIKKAFRVKSTSGRSLATGEERALIDRYVQIKIDKRFKAALEFNDEEATLSIQNFGSQYAAPSCTELAYDVDQEGAMEMTHSTFHHDGTPGTAISVERMQKLAAHMEEVAIPMNMRRVAVMQPSDIAEMSHDVFLVNNPKIVYSAIRNALSGQVADLMMVKSIHVPTYRVPSQTGHTPVIDSTSPKKGNTIKISGVDNSDTTALFLRKGNLIQIAGVGEIHPRGRRDATGRSATFTVTADVLCTAATVDVPIYPEINDGTTNGQTEETAGDGTTMISLRDYETVDKIPVNNAAVTVLGAGTTDAEQQYTQVEAYDTRALQYVFAVLKRLRGMPHTARRSCPDTNIAISVSESATIRDMENLMRFDILFGVKNVYPELGMRMITAKL